jgi:murein DD-endopeptidase MepM/ murein hydrolase activator NlpD
MKKSLPIIVICCVFLTANAHALELNTPAKAMQGDLIMGRTQPGAEVWIKTDSVPVSPQGYFAIAVPRLQKSDLVVSAVLATAKTSRIIRILAYPWKIQRIDGLANRYVNPNPEALARIKKDNRVVRDIRNSPSHPRPLFLKKGFIKPVAGRTSSPFGSQRILNGEPKSPHSGLDLAAPKGTPVVNPADGIVCLTLKDTYLMGNVLMIDHGLGVRSIFIHLDSIDVEQGDFIPRGSRIARVGQTGRATGPHLHWGVSVGSILINPPPLIIRNLLEPF